MSHLLLPFGIVLLGLASWLYHSAFLMLREMMVGQVRDKWVAWFAVDAFVWRATAPSAARTRYLVSIIIAEAGSVAMMMSSSNGADSMIDAWWFVACTVFALVQLTRGGLRAMASR